ncbi:hypothetical protein MITS9509_01568 [Synechococcus sp. MIT S9509]|uniref:DUF1651 domain-containing protein n=1 Tax=unclassified Synechococcus TaxID=2626047 RepID=UPI0007BBDE87|nr:MULTISPECIES: DUF1651 domain-containing protein [unclassified Synechococcus]KZR88105.1 hypothetical protein MITS9504_00532 [Synechococcus sp. MIT S9504]KZR92110.1 hypothetical protein MITS9509_01568 [Synechococcus sp. MIT S9509]
MKGLLTIANNCQTVSFLSDPSPTGSTNDVFVIVDHIKDMPEGHPPLLKTRRYMRYEDAVALWKELQRCGWTLTNAA